LCYRGGRGAPDFGLIDLIVVAQRRADAASSASLAFLSRLLFAVFGKPFSEIEKVL
jgi:hypothetical protein